MPPRRRGVELLGAARHWGRVIISHISPLITRGHAFRASFTSRASLIEEKERHDAHCRSILPVTGGLSRAGAGAHQRGFDFERRMMLAGECRAMRIVFTWGCTA